MHKNSNKAKLKILSQGSPFYLSWSSNIYPISGYVNIVSDVGHAFAHARYLSTTNRVWLSEDPMALAGFSSDVFLLNPQNQNSYSYAGNNPVGNVDPDGRVVVIVNGTLFGGLNRNWDAHELVQSIKNDDHFRGQAIGQFNWGGADNDNARAKGERALSEFIEATMKMYPNEPLNIFSHSHGGQLVAMYSQEKHGYKMNNVVTIETPNIGMQFDESKISNHIQTYSHNDLVQFLGGTQINASDVVGIAIFGYKALIPGSGLTGVMSMNFGQFGHAERTFPGAKNIDITAAQKATNGKDVGLVSSFYNAVSNHFISNSGNSNVYSNYIEPNLKY